MIVLPIPDVSAFMLQVLGYPDRKSYFEAKKREREMMEQAMREVLAAHKRISSCL